MDRGLAPVPGHSQEDLLEWLEMLLRLTGWSPSKLAKEAGVAASTVNKFLGGAGHLLSTTSIGRIQRAADRRYRERVARGEIGPADNLTPDGRAIDKMITIMEVDGRAPDPRKQPVQPWGFPENWFRFTYNADPTQCLIISIEDDAMFSDLRIGDRVVIDTSRTTPSPAGTFIIDDGMSWTARRIEVVAESAPPSVMISARNPDYRTTEAHLSAIKIVGRVMGMWRRM